MCLLAFDQIVYTYPGQAQPALRGVTLSLAAGMRVALVGRNGSGKSTLLLHGNGVLRPAQGAVRLAHRRVRYDRAGLLELRRQVGFVFQQADDQLFSASVAQDLSFGPLNLGLPVDEVRRRVAEAAEICGLSDLRDRPTHALSGGERTRAALAGVLAMEPAVLLADEVTANLDPPMRRQVVSIFNQLVATGRTVVWSTHDLTVARRWADRVAVMDAGSIIAYAPPDQIFADAAILAQAGLSDPWETLAPQGLA